MGKKTIAVVGASSGAGATFIASRLAVAMGQTDADVTFLERNDCTCNRCERLPLVYYELELYKTFRFTDFFFEKATGRPVNNHINYLRGVNWVVRTPASPPCTILPEEVAGRYIIWDTGSDFMGADLILCVLAAEAKHLMAGLDIIRFCRDNCRGKTLFIFNRLTSEAAAKSAEKLLQVEADFCIGTSNASQEEVISQLSEYILTLF